MNFWFLDKRIKLYHYHIRKTGGTSINMSFIKSLFKGDKKVYGELSRISGNKIKKNGYSLVGWNKKSIESGKFNYGFSHIPFHELKMKSNIQTMTCFRDPVSRVLSHYKMLKRMRDENSTHPCMKTEGDWVSKDFDYFLKSIPKEHLLNQLFMFSKDFNIQQAKENIESVDFVLSTENLNHDLDHLGATLGLDFEKFSEKRSQNSVDITTSQYENLRELLSDEYDLLKEVQN